MFQDPHRPPCRFQFFGRRNLIFQPIFYERCQNAQYEKPLQISRGPKDFETSPFFTPCIAHLYYYIIPALHLITNIMRSFHTRTQPAASPRYDTLRTIIYCIIPSLCLITNNLCSFTGSSDSPVSGTATRAFKMGQFVKIKQYTKKRMRDLQRKSSIPWRHAITKVCNISTMNILQ